MAIMPALTFRFGLHLLSSLFDRGCGSRPRSDKRKFDRNQITSELPVLVEESGYGDCSIRRHDRVVPQPGKQQRIGTPEFLLAEGVPAVDHHVPLGVERVRIDQNGDMTGCAEFLRAYRDLRLRPV